MRANERKLQVGCIMYNDLASSPGKQDLLIPQNERGNAITSGSRLSIHVMDKLNIDTSRSRRKGNFRNSLSEQKRLGPIYCLRYSSLSTSMPDRQKPACTLVTVRKGVLSIRTLATPSFMPYAYIELSRLRNAQYILFERTHSWRLWPYHPRYRISRVNVSGENLVRARRAFSLSQFMIRSHFTRLVPILWIIHRDCHDLRNSNDS